MEETIKQIKEVLQIELSANQEKLIKKIISTHVLDALNDSSVADQAMDICFEDDENSND